MRNTSWGALLYFSAMMLPTFKLIESTAWIAHLHHCKNSCCCHFQFQFPVLRKPSELSKSKMFQKEKPMSLKSSASAICNNLSIQVSPAKKMINYAVVHKSVVNLVSACMDGSTVNHRQVVCKESSMASMILQASVIQTMY